jgi:hypothetical protein
MIQSLLVTLVVKVGFCDIGMGLDKVEMWFAMGEDKDFGECKLVHADAEELLRGLAFCKLV